jgi:hypothetical protein
MPRASLLQLFRILETQQRNWDEVRAKLASEQVSVGLIAMVVEWARAGERLQIDAPAVATAVHPPSAHEAGQAVRVPEAAPVDVSQQHRMQASPQLCHPLSLQCSCPCLVQHF